MADHMDSKLKRMKRRMRAGRVDYARRVNKQRRVLRSPKNRMRRKRRNIRYRLLGV